MTPEKQRIAIAEACGIIAQYNKIYGWIDQIGCAIPDYLNDLNSMHEAEKMLETTRSASDFCNEIGGVILRNAGLNPTGHCGIWRKIHATAAQRAEAFLRTLNLWVDEQPELNQ